VVSAASDETYLRPNDYCQLVLVRRDGAACREAPPPTRRPPVATGAADGPPGPAGHQILCAWSDACGTDEGVAVAGFRGR
jgi:hypothetical protein